MGTQCVVSILNQGKVIEKIVAGCDGQSAEKLARSLADASWPFVHLDDLRDYALSQGVGCDQCLIVMDADSHEGPEDIGPLYREKFGDPAFNPRWPQGTAEHVWTVELSTKQVTRL